MPDFDLVIFTYSLPFGTGEPFLMDELAYLGKNFRKIHLFPLFYGKSHVARELPANVTFSDPFIRFDIKRDRLKLLRSGIFCASPLNFVFREFLKRGLYKNREWIRNWLGESLIARILLKSRNMESITGSLSSSTIIYFYWGDKSTGIVPCLKKRVENPVIVRFHGSDLYETAKGGYIPYRASLLQHLDYALFISGNGEKYLKEKYPSIPFQPRLFRLGVTNHDFRSGSTDGIFRIVSCSNVIPLKRLKLLMEALFLLKSKISWTHFGGGPLLDELKAAAKSAPQNISIDFTGQVAKEEVLSFYSENPVDLFVNVSESEGIPVSIMEAMSFGIPVLATNVGGVSEIVGEGSGILVDAETTPGIIAGKILSVINMDENLRLSMRRNACHWQSLHFDADKTYSGLCRFFREIQG